MSEEINLVFDTVHDFIWMISLGKLSQVFRLFYSHGLDKRLTNLPVIWLDLSIVVKRFDLPSLFLKLDVHFPYTTNRVSFLPDKLQIFF